MKLIIENYKNITHLEINVVNNKVLLLGSNGVGKSNVLEAIYKGHWWMEDSDQTFDGSYLLNLDISHSLNDYYPHASLLNSFFPNRRRDLPSQIISFLNEAYNDIQRPLLKERIKSAVESLKYSAQNKVFDPSSLAIIRLVLLHKLYKQAKEENRKFIILIDNPELYCHPLLVDEIASVLLNLQKEGSLIIASTHDDHFISLMFSNFGEIVKLTKNAQSNVEAFTLDIQATVREISEFYSSQVYLTHSFSNASNVDSAIMQLLEGNNIESFLITTFRDRIITAYFSECVVLGEGASEDVLFDYITSEVNPTWIQEYLVGFISCLGKSTMPLYFITLKHLGVKVLCMFDYDRPDNPVHRAYFDAFLAYHRDNRDMFRYYYLRPDLENYLNMLPENRLVSLIKPVNIFNFTYLHKEDNPALDQLIETIHEHVKSLCQRKGN
ncbi:MAG: hypothetical protein II126_01120 [Erysipelotrichaceae bacterium]|nr:hypothetical protein [Erysipelotrichaceae bacterium]